MEILKLLFPLVIIVLLLALRKNLALTILISGITLGLLFKMTPREILIYSFKALVEKNTLKLLGIIYLVLVLGEVLRIKRSLEYLVEGLEGIVKKKKLIISTAPAIIGLLPMPGGALVSAPILDQALKKDPVTPEQKTFINFWFRHIWEYVWPLYQGLILTAAIFRVDIVKLIKAQFLFTPIAIIIGAFYLIFLLPPLKNELFQRSVKSSLKKLFLSLWEILLIVALIIALNLDLLLALTLTIFISLLLFKEKPREKIFLLKKGFKWNILTIIAAVMIFKNMVLHSQVVELTERVIQSAGSYEKLIMFLIPFSIGFLTGVNTAFAGIAFPFFIPSIGTIHPVIQKIVFLYVSGFAGVLLSPFHLCFALSAEYYKANLLKVYKYLLPSVLLIILFLLAFF